jgi:hypothetical protein
MSVWQEFDAYCDENNIPMEETHIAFAAFLHLKTGWDGESHEVDESEYYTKTTEKS